MGFAVNFSLVSTLPAYLLASCTAALARPAWEPLLYYSLVRSVEAERQILDLASAIEKEVELCSI